MSDQTRKPTPMPGSFLAPQAAFLTTEDAQASYGFAAAPLVGGAETFSPMPAEHRAKIKQLAETAEGEDPSGPWAGVASVALYAELPSSVVLATLGYVEQLEADNDRLLGQISSWEIAFLKMQARAEKAEAEVVEVGRNIADCQRLVQESGAMVAEANRAVEEADELLAKATARLEEEKTAAAESEREKLEAYKELAVQDGVMQQLRNENTRLLRNAGYGSVADQAPDEIHLCGDPAMGCDAWLCIARVQMENGVPTADWQMAMAAYRATDAVRYVKAAPAPVQGEGEEGKGHPAELALAEIRDYLKDQSERRGHILDVDIPHLIDSVIGPEVSDSRWEQFRDEPGLDELPF